MSTNRATTCRDLLVRHGRLSHGEALRINLDVLEHLDVVALINVEASSKHWILSQGEVSASMAVLIPFQLSPFVHGIDLGTNLKPSLIGQITCSMKIINMSRHEP
jgi:hypothetical protein